MNLSVVTPHGQMGDSSDSAMAAEAKAGLQALRGSVQVGDEASTLTSHTWAIKAATSHPSVCGLVMWLFWAGQCAR